MSIRFIKGKARHRFPNTLSSICETALILLLARFFSLLVWVSSARSSIWYRGTHLHFLISTMMVLHHNLVFQSAIRGCGSNPLQHSCQLILVPTQLLLIPSLHLSHPLILLSRLFDPSLITHQYPLPQLPELDLELLNLPLFESDQFLHPSSLLL